MASEGVMIALPISIQPSLSYCSRFSYLTLYGLRWSLFSLVYNVPFPLTLALAFLSVESFYDGDMFLSPFFVSYVASRSPGLVSILLIL